MARKKYRKKGRACGLCAPWKAGWTPRWSDRDLARLKEYERARSHSDWTRL